MKIVVLDGHALNPGDNPWAPLEAHGDVVVFDRTPEDEIVERSQGAQILVINKVLISDQVIDELPDLRFIAVTATGYDCVHLEAARRRDIPVANVPVYGTDSVAQYVFALLLHLCHHVGLHDQAVKAGEWGRCADFSFWKTPLIELAEKRMGIVGFGRIGRHVGELAHAFGMRVLAFDTYHGPEPEYGPFSWSELVPLCEQADVVTLHCNLTAENTGLVNQDLLRHFKPSAMLINASRGGLVVDVDLAEALNRGQLAGAALDVVSQEPIAADNPLLTAKNCVVTPHIAWATLEARQRLMGTTISNVAAFLSDKPENVVN